MYSNTDDMNVTSDYLLLSGEIVGAVTVSAGTVNVAELTVKDEKNSLTVASGATLAVEKIGNAEAELTVGKNGENASVVVEGTVAFIEGTIDLTGGIMDVNGTMTVEPSPCPPQPTRRVSSPSPPAE